MITTHQFAKSKLRTTFSLHIEVTLKDLNASTGLRVVIQQHLKKE